LTLPSLAIIRILLNHTYKLLNGLGVSPNLNKKKTKAMWIGIMKHNKTKILEFKSTKDPIKVLGAFLYYNPDKNFELNLLSRFKICGCQEISHFMENLY